MLVFVGICLIPSLSFDRKTGGFQTEVLVVLEVSIGFVEVMNPSQPKKREGAATHKTSKS